MNKFFKTIIVGAASGFAAAYFLSTEKGKEIKKRAEKAFEAYKENPEEYHQKAKEKTVEYTNLATDTFHDYKEKFESGELTKEDIFETVKEKTNQAVDFASDVVSEVKSKFSEVAEEVKDTAENVAEDVAAEVDDIIIDYQNPEEEDNEYKTSEENEEEA